MPYYSHDEEDYDEDENLEESGDEVDESDEQESDESKEEVYEPAGGTFDFSADGFMKVVRDELLAQGISTVNCRYDGGGDEGFAHFDNALQNHSILTLESLIELLKDGPILDPSLATGRYQGYPAHALKSLLGEAATHPAGRRIAGTLEEFATRLATRLLGEGFGTGDYTMRGRFSADLHKGSLVDLKDGE